MSLRTSSSPAASPSTCILLMSSPYCWPSSSTRATLRLQQCEMHAIELGGEVLLRLRLLARRLAGDVATLALQDDELGLERLDLGERLQPILLLIFGLDAGLRLGKIGEHLALRSDLGLRPIDLSIGRLLFEGRAARVVVTQADEIVRLLPIEQLLLARNAVGDELGLGLDAGLYKGELVAA